jgi:hypothetical protein
MIKGFPYHQLEMTERPSFRLAFLFSMQFLTTLPPDVLPNLACVPFKRNHNPTFKVVHNKSMAGGGGHVIAFAACCSEVYLAKSVIPNSSFFPTLQGPQLCFVSPTSGDPPNVVHFCPLWDAN